MAAGSFSSRLIILFVLLAVFSQPSSCRPLPNSNGGASVKATANIIALATETVVVAAAGGAPAATGAKLGDRYGNLVWLLNSKPRGRAPPSAPSKRTNDIHN